MENINYIYTNGFWDGFVNKTDANHIGFFENVFKKTKLLGNSKLTNDIRLANVLFESVFAPSLVGIKQWKYKIHYSGEKYVGNYSNYDLVLYSEPTHDNVVDVPLFVYYIHGNNFMDKLTNRPIITKIPEHFCCFIVSNGNCSVRNNMFEQLCRYKKVHSYGNYCNNMGQRLNFNYWTKEFHDFISNYKFIICFENAKIGSYSTEKIVNPYLSRIIPIYWSASHIHNVFNSQSMLFLEDENNFQTIINQIIELDNSDDKYLEFVNRPIFTDGDYWTNHYTCDAIANKIDDVKMI